MLPGIFCVFLAACPAPTAPGAGDASAAQAVVARPRELPRLLAIGPRLLSNQTSQPLSIWATHLKPGMTLELSGAVTLSLPLVVLDEGHAFARLPAHLETNDGLSEGVIVPALSGGEGTVAPLILIADTHFPDLTSIVASPDGAWLFAVSAPDDCVYALEVATKQVTRLQTADGPSAIALWTDPQKKAWVVVAHRFSPTVMLLPVAGGDPKSFPAPRSASGLAIKGDVLFLAEQGRDTVSALALTDGGKEKWRTPVGPNPDHLAVTAKGLVVGCSQSGDLEWLDAATGQPIVTAAPGPGAVILGGGTAKFSQYVMNGSAARALVWSSRLNRLFAATIGPNIGPNPEKMEVSMNGGVSVFEHGKFVRHLGFGAGVTQALALDDARGLLYAADVSLGLVRVLDAKKLAGSDAAAQQALLQELAVPAPAESPRIRPLADFGVKGRAGDSLHSGPQALALSSDGKTLWVLNRFTGGVARLDVSAAGRARAEWKEQLPLYRSVEQKERRLGQTLFFADFGRTAMSCDACHLEGHTGGVLFEKTSPLRIYRSPTVRSARVTPPYFTPASTRSMGETSKVVGGRNRFHNADPTDSELEQLTIYSSLITTPPNPFVGADGAPVEALVLPDGKTGNPRAGLALFEGKANCSGCHPGPHFTTDQDPPTRGKFVDVGTPQLMPLREKLQNPHFSGFAPPALAGSWDVFPMLTTGLAGLKVNDDGRVGVDDRFPLRRAIEGWPGKHGHADQLSAQEKNDLLAYVLSL